MDIKSLISSIENNMEYKGVSVELNDDFNSKFFELDKEKEKENLSIYLRGDCDDSNTFLYHFCEMLKEGKINISFNEKATQKDLDYFDKLSESFMKDQH